MSENKKNRLIGHRGYPAVAPENTRQSFIEAKRVGLDAIECDVQLTKCNSFIIIHDTTLDRTTNGKGPIWQLTLQEIKTLDAGSWFHHQYAQERILELSEALELFNSLGISVNLELKLTDEQHEAFYEAWILFSRENIYLFQRILFISSFDTKLISRIQKIYPQFSYCFLIEKIHLDDIENFENIDAICTNYQTMVPSIYKLCAKHDIKLYLYTVNSKKVFQDIVLKYAHVLGFFTDDPKKLLENG